MCVPSGWEPLATPFGNRCVEIFSGAVESRKSVSPSRGRDSGGSKDGVSVCEQQECPGSRRLPSSVVGRLMLL